jgi:ABC-type glycerol-3-phosphate transport system permease component
MAAGSLLSLLPTLIVFLVFQRSLVHGVTVGSIR